MGFRSGKYRSQALTVRVEHGKVRTERPIVDIVPIRFHASSVNKRFIA